MNQLTDIPNIGKTLAAKLQKAGIHSEQELKALGSEKAIIRIDTMGSDTACLNMLYALEGAVQGIRWHKLSDERKQELKNFYTRLRK